MLVVHQEQRTLTPRFRNVLVWIVEATGIWCPLRLGAPEARLVTRVRARCNVAAEGLQPWGTTENYVSEGSPRWDLKYNKSFEADRACTHAFSSRTRNRTQEVLRVIQRATVFLTLGEGSVRSTHNYQPSFCLDFIRQGCRQSILGMALV